MEEGLGVERKFSRTRASSILKYRGQGRKRGKKRKGSERNASHREKGKEGFLSIPYYKKLSQKRWKKRMEGGWRPGRPSKNEEFGLGGLTPAESCQAPVLRGKSPFTVTPGGLVSLLSRGRVSRERMVKVTTC